MSPQAGTRPPWPRGVPTISIAVGTVQGWPQIRACVATWEAAAEAAGGELMVADGSGRERPAPGNLSPLTTWRQVPGASVFQLRELAYRASGAPIVAITEDHCRVPADWAMRWLAAFRANPEAAAIGGSVENGATSRVIDWASFLVVQALSVPPVPTGPVTRLAGAVNVAYRRVALAGIDDHDGLGAMDAIHQRNLRRAGNILLSDDSIRVVHDQSLGVRGTSVIHFHAGRTFAAFLRRRSDLLAWLRFLGVLIIPYARLVRAVAVACDRGYGRVVARAWPAMLWLFWCQAAGQLVGFFAGPGDSPRRVQ
jgi:hypothetical protein